MLICRGQVKSDLIDNLLKKVRALQCSWLNLVDAKADLLCWLKQQVRGLGYVDMVKSFTGLRIRCTALGL